MNYITELLKQSVDKLVIVVIFCLGFKLMVTVPTILDYNNVNYDPLLTISFFINVFLFIISLCVFFLFHMKPNTTKIMNNLLVKKDKTIVVLPELYCFKSQGSLKLLSRGGKDIEKLLIYEKDNEHLPLLDLDKIQIEIKDENNEEIPIELKSGISSQHEISITFKSKQDIYRAKKMLIQADNDGQFNLVWNCSN